MTVRALICSTPDGLDSLTIGELPTRELGATELRIRVEASGINFPDILVVQGLYQFQPEPPFAPGLEASGVVTEIGPEVENFTHGDQVFAFLPTFGGHAEEIVVEESATYPLPADLDLVAAAGIGLTYGTSYHALVDRAHLRRGETMLVLGAAGGVGSAAVQIGAALGAHVIAGVSSDAKADVAISCGARDIIRYDREDLRARLKELAPEGVDVTYDPVGGAATETALRASAWGGRVLIIGFAAGGIPSVATNLPLLKGASLVGVFWGRFAEKYPGRHRSNMSEITRMWTEGQIEPLISEEFALDDGARALRLMAERGAIGKLVLRP